MILKYKSLTAEEFKNNMGKDAEAVVLDVRTESEYKSGHLKQAINTPNIKERVILLDKNKHYYLHCRVGGRSAIASQILVSNGFEHVFNLNAKLEDLDIELVK